MSGGGGLNSLKKATATGIPDLDIPAGSITGVSSVNKFGNNPALATSATETVWDGSNVYTFPATALITSISQTADQAAMRGANIELHGLDASWNSIVQTFPLDASDTTTPVVFTATTDAVLATTGVAMLRVFRKRVLADVVSASPIRAHNVGETVDYAIIGTGNNQTMMAVYTVPADTTAYMTQYYASLNKDSGGGDPDVLIKLWASDRANSYAAQIKHAIGLDEDGGSHFSHPFAPYVKFTEKTDLYITATNLSGSATADVSAGFDLILVDN